ncbi:MAG: restriction endonuclease subunit S [Microcoleaceae cyanobacterium]
MISTHNEQVPAGYKNTEVGLIPEDWNILSLQELTDKSNPITYGVLKPGDYTNNGIPLLQIKDVIHGKIKIEELHKISKELDSQYSRTRLYGGEIVISLVGTIGRIAYIPSFLSGANLHRNLAKISIAKKYESEFIFYQLESTRIQESIKLTTFGSTQSLLNLADLRALLLVLPPLPEQKAIAQVLSDTDTLISALNKLIAKKRNIKTATMQQLLTGKKRLPGFGEGKGYKNTEVGLIPEDWEVKKLIDVVDYADYRGKTPPKKKSGIFLVTARNIRDGWIDYEVSKEYISEADYDKVMRRGQPKIGDVIITTEAPLGNVATVDNENIALAQRVIKYRAKDNNLTQNYLKYYLLSEKFQRLLYDNSSGSTAQGIKGSILHTLPIILSTSKEQKAIAQTLSDMDAEITALETRLNKTKAIKQGMMQELLTGKVRLK